MVIESRAGYSMPRETELSLWETPLTLVPFDDRQASANLARRRFGKGNH